MDSLFHSGLNVAASAEPRALLGILYAEDFDDPPEAVPEPEPKAAAQAAPACITQDDIDRACAAAVEHARTSWEATLLQHRTEALASVASAIGAARAEADREAAAIAEGMVGTILSLLSGALPRLCREHGPEEVRDLMRHLLPTFQRETRVIVRVHPSLVPVLQKDFALLDEDLAEAVKIAAAALPPGDVKVTWAEGSFTRDTSKLLAAMQDVLAQLGLLEPLNIATERRMAIVE